MAIYKILLSYKGTGFLGWQIQPQKEQTIQGQLNLALEKIVKSSEIKTLSSGRTDAGVHALGQVVRVELPIYLPLDSLKKALNDLLPKSIQVLETQECDEVFHPIRDAQSKTYCYFFTAVKPHPLWQELVTFYPYPLDHKLMQKACQEFKGSHDFKNFMCEGTPVSSTVRTIFSCSLKQQNASAWGPVHFPDTWCLMVRGNGFLKQMVRLMMGSLWEVGRGKKTLLDLKKHLATAQSDRLGPVAPPQGLYLKAVEF